MWLLIYYLRSSWWMAIHSANFKLIVFITWGKEMSSWVRKIHIFPPNAQQKDKIMLMKLIKGVKEILKFHDSRIWCDIFHWKEYCFQLGLIVKIRSRYVRNEKSSSAFLLTKSLANPADSRDIVCHLLLEFLIGKGKLSRHRIGLRKAYSLIERRAIYKNS